MIPINIITTIILFVCIWETNINIVLSMNVGKLHEKNETKSFGNPFRNLCASGLGLVEKLYKGTILKSIIHFFILKICQCMYAGNVCTKLDEIYYDTAEAIIFEGILIPEKLCKLRPSILYNWTVDIPKISLYLSRQNHTEKKNNSTSVKTTYKILQISDIHFDDKYDIGSEAICQYPLCCRKFSDSNHIAKNPASKFGEYKCDTNTHMFESMLDYATSLADIDYVLMTGDTLPHDIWLGSHSTAKKTINETYSILKKYFKNIPIYPSVGNHESFPTNFFPSKRTNKYYNISWLYDELTEIWSSWLPSSTHQTIRNGGFYSVRVKPSLKLVQINSIFCYTHNMWLYYDNVDPFDQLKWLVEELLDAESKHLNVHIIMHVPWSFSQCDVIWKGNFDRIVERFSNSVKGIFAGHVHKDIFQVRFDTNKRTVPKHVTYISPSVTPFNRYNPRFRVYEIDAKSHNVIDHQTYYYDINEAKANGIIQWKLLYSAKSEFNFEDLSPQSWANLMKRLKCNPNLWKNYSKLVFGRKSNSPWISASHRYRSNPNMLYQLIWTAWDLLGNPTASSCWST